MGKTVLDEYKTALALRYYDEGFTLRKIAEAFGVSAGAIYFRVKDAGKLRSGSSAYKYSEWSFTEEGRKRTLEAAKKPMSEETRAKISEQRKLHGIGHTKKRKDGYIGVYFPEHPDANKEGYVMQHRLLMEQHLGRRLNKDEVVHHMNKDRADNRLENLCLMTASAHMSMHMYERHKKEREEKK